VWRRDARPSPKKGHRLPRAVKERIDPIDARNVSRAAAVARNAKSKSFDECAAECIAAQRAGWSNAKHRQQWTNTLKTYASPVLGRLPSSAIDVDLVVKALQPIWEKKPETASRARERIEAVLAWATTRKLRQGDNPARWQDNLEHLCRNAPGGHPPHRPALCRDARRRHTSSSRTMASKRRCRMPACSRRPVGQ
jgi:hypothetical protein